MGGDLRGRTKSAPGCEVGSGVAPCVDGKLGDRAGPAAPLQCLRIWGSHRLLPCTGTADRLRRRSPVLINRPVHAAVRMPDCFTAICRGASEGEDAENE